MMSAGVREGSGDLWRCGRYPPEKTKIFSPENGVPLEVKGDSELGILPPFSGGNSLFVSGRVSFKTELDVAGSSNHQSE